MFNSTFITVPHCKRENDIDRDVTESDRSWPGPQGGSFDISTSNQESHDGVSRISPISSSSYSDPPIDLTYCTLTITVVQLMNSNNVNYL